MKKRKLIIALIIVVAVCLIGGGIVLNKTMEENANAGSEVLNMRLPEKSDDPNVLNVAMFPYVPNMDFMEKTAEDMFKEIAPEVTLNFVDWDCYISSTPDDVDVFTFDAAYMYPLLDNGYLKEINIEDFPSAQGIMPFATAETVVTKDGETHSYGVPSLLCSYWMIYRDGDEEIAKVNSVNDLYKVIGDNKVGKNSGLLCNFQDDHPYYYLEAINDDAVEENRNVEKYLNDYNQQAVDTVEKIHKMSRKNWIQETPLLTWLRGEFATGAEFKDGKGRALIGYSEEMFNLHPVIDNINVKLISMGNGDNRTIFFADLTSINAKIKDERKIENCKKFVDLLVSKDYINKIADNGGSPTYLLPIRSDCYDSLAAKYPMYSELKSEIDKADKHVAVYGSWINIYVEHLIAHLTEMIE